MIDPRWDEQAALAALGWPDDPAALDRASAQDPEVAGAVSDYADVAALLAYDAPQQEPPAALRERIMGQLDGPLPVLAAQGARLIRFPRALIYAVSACLMGLVLLETEMIREMKHMPILAGPTVPKPSSDFDGVELADLAPQGDHGDAKVMVAWDKEHCCGMLHMQDMPPAPAGSDYQVWVLDPSKDGPVSVGVVDHGASTKHFEAGEVHMPGRPGFAVSLEPAGGRPTPTTILFAVAPSP